MKNLTLALFALITICIVACKKKVDPVLSTPTPPAVTSDFRDKYTGDFRLYSTYTYVVHRSDMGGQRDTTITNNIDDVMVSYSISDSIEVLSPVATERGTYPAITFTYTTGDKFQYGIETNGHMIRKYQSHGWFITADSFVFSSGTYATNYTSIAIMEGKRK